MGLVVVSSPDGHIHAFEADGCGAATCEPVWSAAVAGTPGSPIVKRAGHRHHVDRRGGGFRLP